VLIVLQKGIAAILVTCVLLGESVENFERPLCAISTVRRYIDTEIVSAETEGINMLIS
jgi:hypothetical protein